MVILAIADLHFEKTWFDFVGEQARRKACDVITIAGDSLSMFAAFGSDSSMRSQARYVREFLTGLEIPVFACTGNHDIEIGDEHGDERDFLHRAAAANPNVRGDGAMELLGDMRFFVLGWGQPAPYFWPHSEPACIVAHAPPLGTKLSVGETGECGDRSLRSLAMRLPAGSLILSGHVHAPKFWAEKLGDAWALNPGCADYPRPIPAIPNHIFVDTSIRIAERRTAHGSETLHLD
jgi:Icc-related predicted phosphoesterase